MECVDACSYNALSGSEGRLNVNFDKCTGCGDCLKECAYGALKVYGYSADAEGIVTEVLKDKDYFDNSGGGITLTGGDPVFQPEFTHVLLKRAKEKGLHTCLETSGYCKPEVIEKLAEVTDLFLFDFKHYKNSEHINHTGVGNDIILENLDFLCRNNHKVILRCPVIPGVNDTLQHFEAIAEVSNRYESIKAVEIMPFHDWGFHKYELIGKNRPAIHSETIPKETKQKWIDGLERLGCRKIVKA